MVGEGELYIWFLPIVDYFFMVNIDDFRESAVYL